MEELPRWNIRIAHNSSVLLHRANTFVDTMQGNLHIMKVDEERISRIAESLQARYFNLQTILGEIENKKKFIEQFFVNNEAMYSQEILF